MASVYLDEHLGDFKNDLQASDHNVVFAGEPGRTGHEDAWHFKEALHDRRVIVTLDRGDFLYIHRLWTTLFTLGEIDVLHPGILTAAVDANYDRDTWLARIKMQIENPSDLAGRMLRWLPSGGRWKEEQRPER